MPDKGWSRTFDEPVPLPRGRQLVTLNSLLSGNFGDLFASSLFAIAAHHYKIDTDLIAIDPCQFATAVGQTAGRKHQKKFLEMEPFDAVLHN